jgi:hypothetical protein
MMKLTKQAVAMGIVGLLLGAGITLGIRFATYSPAHVHYHANFDVYINGQREVFNSPLYYEEKGGGTCTADTTLTPLGRAHMHDNVSDVVHVEDRAVTWGQFFENLRWAVNDMVIKTPDAVHLADNTNHITFIINGHAIQDISTETIHDKDRLLVDFGPGNDATVQKEFTAVPSTAAKYDAGKDPVACMGSAAPTVRERLHHLF